MPDFIALLRDIRDRMYPEIKSAYESFLGATVGSTTNIDPIDGVVQPATATFDQETGEFDFGIPTSPIVDNTDASLIRADGTVPMDTGYVPTLAKDVTTKEYIDGVAYGWVQKWTGHELGVVANVWGDGLYTVEGTTTSNGLRQNNISIIEGYPSTSELQHYPIDGAIHFDSIYYNSGEISCGSERMNLTDNTRSAHSIAINTIWKWEKL